MSTVTWRLPFSFARAHNIFVQAPSHNETENEDKNATDDTKDHVVMEYLPPLSPQIMMECQRICPYPITWQVYAGDDFPASLAAAYESNTDAAMAEMQDLEEQMDLSDLISQLPKTQDLLESEDDAPIIRLLNASLTEAVKKGASDVHFEVFEKTLCVRFRIDGILHEVFEPPRALAALIISRLKIMAKLDIAEKRLPQDGRISLKIAGRSIDIRVSTMPTHYGERIVLRLLDKKQAPLDLSALGMADDTRATMESLISQPHGIILVTGPTGSGKTTSLYAGLNQLNEQCRNIMTVEDPIEYYLSGIAQTQVNTKADMTFARGLRAILRQDPDVIMVGEIRDLETAEMAVQASLTGHLVLSTLHTNSALGAITRLQDMGVEPFLVSNTLIGVAAQRLVRVLCPHCKRKAEPTEQESALLKAEGFAAEYIYHSVGCKECQGGGYSGRTGIYEVIPVDSTLSEMIHRGASEGELVAYGHQSHRSMRGDGMRRVVSGETTIEEVCRVSSES